MSIPRFAYYNVLWVFLGLSAFIFLYFHYYPSGQVEEEQIVEQSGVKDGPIDTYDANGNLKTRVNYLNGIKHGISYLYDENGKVQLEMQYIHGMRHGVSKKYYQDGTVYAETPYVHDRLSGVRTLYFRSGKKKAEIPYFNNNPGIGLIEYMMDGKPKDESSYPEIKFTRKEQVLWLYLSETCRKPRFYIGDLVNDRFLDTDPRYVVNLTVESGRYYINLDVFTPSYLAMQDVICRCTTTQGNPLVLRKRIVL